MLSYQDMFNFIKTLQFFHILLKQRVDGVQIEEHHLTLENGVEMPIDVYDYKTHPKGYIVFVHGKNRPGYRDPRGIAFCKAMAHYGYRVIAPSYQRISNLQINIDVVNDVVFSINDILHKTDLVPTQQLAIFTVSYSGTIALHAAAKPLINQHISAFCTIGSSSSFVRSCRHALSEKGCTDIYARLIFLRALFHYSKDKDDALDKALVCAIDDDFAKHQTHDLTDYLTTLPTEQAQQYQHIVDNIMHTDHYLTQYQDVIDDLENRLTRSSDLHDLRCKIALIHSVKDKIFPPAESAAMYDDFTRMGIETKMVITPLLDHVDANFSLRKIKDIWRLINVFSFFFKHV